MSDEAEQRRDRAIEDNRQRKNKEPKPLPHTTPRRPERPILPNCLISGAAVCSTPFATSFTDLRPPAMDFHCPQSAGRKRNFNMTDKFENFYNSFFYLIYLYIGADEPEKCKALTLTIVGDNENKDFAFGQTVQLIRATSRFLPIEVPLNQIG
jgi:hypothetical protein